MSDSIPTIQAVAKEGGDEWRRLLQGYFESSPIATFVIDLDHRVIVWNRALEVVNGIPAEDMLGTRRHWKGGYDEERPTMADLLLDGALANEQDRVNRLYPAGWRASKIVSGAYETEGKFPNRSGGPDRWLYLTAAPLYDSDGNVVGAIETLQDITERKQAEEENAEYRLHLEELVAERTRELTEVNDQLKSMNRRLEEAHNQMLQAEKMAAIGQLAAGVAHEINNPIGFITSNLGTLESYAGGLLSLVEVYEQSEQALSTHLEQVLQVKQDLDLEYLRSDLFDLLRESRDGLERVKCVVNTLKAFSHVDHSSWIHADLHEELDNTLELVRNRIDPGVQVVQEYGELPPVECQPLELNQVFMNLMLNAVQAIEREGKIRIRTGIEGDQVWVEVADTGRGIPEENLGRIFEPFYTTRPVGTGTGLGLSLSYSIMEKHHGRIEVDSTAGHGARFRLWLPVNQPETS